MLSKQKSEGRRSAVDRDPLCCRTQPTLGDGAPTLPPGQTATLNSAGTSQRLRGTVWHRRVMQVLIRKAGTALYWNAAGRWTDSREQASDLREVCRAVMLCIHRGWTDAELVIRFEPGHRDAQRGFGDPRPLGSGGRLLLGCRRRLLRGQQSGANHEKNQADRGFHWVRHGWIILCRPAECLTGGLVGYAPRSGRYPFGICQHVRSGLEHCSPGRQQR